MRTSSPRLRWVLLRARLALGWERLARVWWPAAFFPAAFVIAAVAGVWNALGDPWRAGALLVSTLAAVAFVLRGLRGPWPSRDDALRRVEEDSGFAGRPFEALEDSPVASDPAGRALWRAHQIRVRDSLGGAKARRPRAALAQADPFALRGVAALAALGAALIAGPAARERIADAFALHAIGAPGPSGGFQAWIDPPDYTGEAPVFLDVQAGGVQRIEAPEGSVFVARATGYRGAPSLLITGPEAPRRERMESIGEGAFETRLTMVAPMSVRAPGSVGAEWFVDVVPDLPPTARFVEPPEPDDRQQMRFTYAAEDDYGLEQVALRIVRRSLDGDDADERPLTTAPAGDGDAEEVLDLTGHRWAGLPVTVWIVARDGQGQIGESAPVRVTLPERVFVMPLARALAHERRRLVRSRDTYAPLADRAPQDADDARMAPSVQPDELERRIDRAPDAVRRARRALQLMQVGAERFSEHLGIHLTLAYVTERLERARDLAEIDDVPEILWDAALRAEGGDLADAERALIAAQRALAEALARGAGEAEINRLMDEFNQAVDRYMEALMAEALMEGRVLEDMVAGGGGAMTGDDIAEMLEALRDLAESGSTDDARRLLQAMSEMLLNMQMNLSAGAGGGQPFDSEELRQLREQLEDLADVISRQRELMDQTFNQNQERNQGEPAPGDQAGQTPQPGEAPGPGQEGAPQTPGDLAGAQRGLLGELQELADGLAEAPAGEGEGEGGRGASDELSGAQRAMRDAAEALGRGDGEGALSDQGEAIERLRAASEALAREALEARQDGSGSGEGEAAAQERDPFGRRSGAGGLGVGDDVAVPDEIDRQRAREILEELRRRMEDMSREEQELEYIRRLLDRF